MQYEIRSPDGERLVERTTLDHWGTVRGRGFCGASDPEPSDGGKRIPLNDCDCDGKAPGDLFYTRVMWQQESRVQEMVDLAVSFF